MNNVDLKRMYSSLVIPRLSPGLDSKTPAKRKYPTLINSTQKKNVLAYFGLFNFLCRNTVMVAAFILLSAP